MQRITLKDRVTLSGVGLFTAKPATVTICPSHKPRGLYFQHLNHSIPVHIDALSSQPVHPVFAQMNPRCTSVGNEKYQVATIEHALSALVGLGITDARIETHAESADESPIFEVPILDGSAIDFVHAIQSVQTQPINHTLQPLQIKDPVRVSQSGASITIEPASMPSYSYTIEYDHPAITNTTVCWNGEADQYTQCIARARTFCLQHEAEAMQAQGLFAHLGPKDMLVLDESGPIENTWRIEHECAYHKLLDLIGDLSLVGQPLCAKVTAIKSGHTLAHQAARAVVDSIRPVNF